MSEEFYILLAILCFGQCATALLMACGFMVLSSYLSSERRRLERMVTNNTVFSRTPGAPLTAKAIKVRPS